MFLFSLPIFFLLITVAFSQQPTQKTHVSKSSTAFDYLLTYYSRHSALETVDLNDMIRKLLYKFGCLSQNCDQVYNAGR